MDNRTRRTIDSLHPTARAWAEAHYEAINRSGILPKGYTVKFISGNRSWEEQDALYAKGRTVFTDEKGNPLSVVTNARAGQSDHNFGIAWDLGIFDAKGNYLGSSPYYQELGPVGEELGLEWGGRWKSFRDYPHYAVRTGLKTSSLRALVLKGQAIPIPEYGRPIPEREDEHASKVLVFEGKTETGIPAFFSAGRVWVAVRPFVNRFGGEVLSVDGHNFVVELHDERISLEGTILGGAGYAKFSDLNRVLEWGYTFEPGRLVINVVEG